VSKRFARLFAASATATGIAVTAAAAPAGAATTTVLLNTRNPTNATNSFCSGAHMLTPISPPGCGSSVTAPVVLVSGQSYSISVAGAISAWGQWPFRRCGKAEPSSEFGSPGATNVPAGDDAQFRFAEPLFTGKCNAPLKKTSFFQINLGTGWFHPIADGNPSKPSNDKSVNQHPYTFTLTGAGVAPQFRFIDYHSSDNSGQFKIAITG
jgi:hypothetical protein